MLKHDMSMSMASVYCPREPGPLGKTIETVLRFKRSADFHYEGAMLHLDSVEKGTSDEYPLFFLEGNRNHFYYNLVIAIEMGLKAITALKNNGDYKESHDLHCLFCRLKQINPRFCTQLTQKIGLEEWRRFPAKSGQYQNLTIEALEEELYRIRDLYEDIKYMGKAAKRKSRKGEPDKKAVEVNPKIHFLLVAMVDAMIMFLEAESSIAARQHSPNSFLLAAEHEDSIRPVNKNPLHAMVYLSSLSEEKIDEAINQGIGIDDPDPCGFSPLHLACLLDNDNKTIEALLLLGKGANINAQDRDGYTPLHCLFDKNKTSMPNEHLFACLLVLGPDLNVKNKQGETAVEMAEVYAGDHAGRRSSFVKPLLKIPSTEILLRRVLDNSKPGFPFLPKCYLKKISQIADKPLHYYQWPYSHFFQKEPPNDQP